MALVQRILVESLPESLTKVVAQTLAGRESVVDGRYVFGAEFPDPAGIVKRLCHHVAGSATALELNQHERTVRCDSQKVDASAKAGVLLSPYKHPLIRYQTRSSDDHVLQYLLFSQ